jgi:hypothetical protein
MSCTGSEFCDCGCCSGTSVQTPQGESNLPGLSAITYRTGIWASFRESMLARLSSSEYPALAQFKTRDRDDFSIAFLDSSAVILDILTFYQERLANESYLRTATQLSSLVWLSRLIGYQPSPGVAASTYLAFTLRAATGLPPNPNATAITIPAGSQAQSVPSQGQTPQAFQTSADILAKPDWNALPVQTGVPWLPVVKQTQMYLAGTATQLNPGDAILIVGDERLNDPTSTVWDLCHIVSVQTDTVNQRTLITWAEPLGTANGSTGPSTINPQVFALRQRAALFGYNAMNPILLTPTKVDLTGLLNSNSTDWNFGTAANSQPSDLASNNLIDLDQVYSKLTNGGWLVLAATLLYNPDLPRPGLVDSSKNRFVEEMKSFGPGSDLGGASNTVPTSYQAAYTYFQANLYYLSSVATVTRSDYGLSAKITRITADTGTELNTFYPQATRSAAAFTQSELLPVCEQPFDHPLYGTLLDLEVMRPDLVGVTAVAVTGKNPKLVVNTPDSPTGRPTVYFSPNDDPGNPIALVQGQVLTLLQPPNSVLNSSSTTNPGAIPSWSNSNATPMLSVADPAGRIGVINSTVPGTIPPNYTPLSYFTLASALASDPVVREVALVSALALSTDSRFPHTQIQLTAPLINVYDRTQATVNCNVGPATAGSPVTELLGSGSAATPNQQFTMKQSPLTYVPSPTPAGSVSSLVVRANGAAWAGVSSLYKQPPTAEVYATVNLPGGKAQVIFGDGVEGATLPTGSNNIQASYRVGIGSAGNVPAGTITTLVDRPVGVSGVSNPQTAGGGQDPQSIEDIRANAPLTVLTLGRAVSLTDYQNFAASFAGISKASALWIPNGAYRGVFLTVASSDGAQLLPSSQTFRYLISALQSYGNPNVALYAASYIETTFGLKANILYDARYSQPAVHDAILSLLQSTYCFANRSFGQGVTNDEIAALIQSVPGVVAVNVLNLKVIGSSSSGDIGSAAYSVAAYYAWQATLIVPQLSRPCTQASNGICAYIPVPSLTQPPAAAEILVLDPDPSNVVLGTMS